LLHLVGDLFELYYDIYYPNFFIFIIKKNSCISIIYYAFCEGRDYLTSICSQKFLVNVLKRKGLKTAHVKPKICLNKLLNIYCGCVSLHTVRYLLFHQGFLRSKFFSFLD
jgi:hypothetical protein